MTLRRRLLAIFAFTVAVSVGLVAWAVSAATRGAFEEVYEERTTALVEQFEREFERRGKEVEQRVAAIAEAEAVVRMAVAVSSGRADHAPYVNLAQELAAEHQLEFLALTAEDGTIISSAHWPARFGYREEWVPEMARGRTAGAFLKREELADETALALLAVEPVAVGERPVYVVGGRRIDAEFLSSLTLPAGMRVVLYRELGAGKSDFASGAGPVADAERLRPLVERAQRGESAREIIEWSGGGEESVHAIPLKGRNGEFLGALLVGSSRAELAALENRIALLALGAALGGMILAVVLSGWAAGRVTRPVTRLAEAAEEVSAGNWERTVEVESEDELGQLAESFNRMTRELVEQRDRLLQAERVAAWRELARRLAHELKNPLFPLQITIENLVRAREAGPEQFDEVFQESTQALLAELANLKTIVGRFSDFAKMPAPEWQPVQVNDLMRQAARLLESQLRAEAKVRAELKLDERVSAIAADPDLLYRAVQNLVLNALDAMPSGGTLTLRTEDHNGFVRLEVSDTGAGLTREECGRLFTPYYTTRSHGTGLGLAIVQSVVSDHHGRVTVESQPGRGTTFRIELPKRQAEEARRAGVE